MKKKYIVYERLNRRDIGKNVFNTARQALLWAVENLYCFTYYKDVNETWEDTFNAELVSIGKGEIVWKLT